MAKIGYARVSTCVQDTALQIDALNRAGVSRIFEEKASSTGRRPQLKACLHSLREGDVMVVWRLDRVARSLRDLLAILDSVEASGAGIQSLTEPLDTTTPMGVFMIQILGAVAELERNIIRERVIAGLVAAHKRGATIGRRKCNLTEVQIEEMRSMYSLGIYSLNEIAREFGVTATTVYRHCSPSYRRPPPMPVISKYL